ncbi:MAG: hypothetical protein HYS81_05495 [Candidatus Aenigmatarchaeota archaeon]|nr:MAG: hypothetical protein HYS81_05495 [Candidatus Aenigmarchaeota archaeon]
MSVSTTASAKRFEKEFHESERRRDILRTLLVESMTERYTVPSPKEFILDEVVNATLAHGGSEKADRIRQTDYRRGKGDPMSYEHELFEVLEGELKTIRKRIESRILDGVVKMASPYMVRSPPDRPHQEVELYTLWESIRPPTMQSSWAVPHRMVANVKNKILPAMSEAERRSVLGIAEEMKPRMSHDFAYIRKHFMW